MRASLRPHLVVAGLLAALGAPRAGAAPITYLDDFPPVGTATGAIAAGALSDPGNADYFRLTIGQRQRVEITGERITPAYDMAFWIYAGEFADTVQIGAFSSGDPRFVAMGDDEIDRPGPYGDPRVLADLDPGIYTIAVVDYHSGAPGADGRYHYRLTVTPVPSAVALLGSGLLALAAAARRRSERAGAA